MITPETPIGEVLPRSTVEQLAAIVQAKPSGTLVWHMKYGKVLAGEFVTTQKLTFLKE